MSNETAAPQSLTEWAQSHFTALFEHNTASASNDAQDDPTPDQSPSLDSQIQAMFSPNAQIFMNHTGPLSVGDFTKQMGQAFGTNQTSVEWKESFEVDDQAQDKTEEGKTGIFAGYLIVTRTLKFRIRAAPAKNYTTISLSAKIAHEPNSVTGSSGNGDDRRIVQLFYTSGVKAAPVHLQGIA